MRLGISTIRCWISSWCVSHTGRNLGRPWGTFLSDAFSRRLLAVMATFDPPSYRACMMVLRECVQRHSRLPQVIVVDGGREFESVYFETLLARYECSKKTRPGAKPRFGSVCERLFGTTNTRFIYNLWGNTQITRNVRQVTKSVSPQEQACWTLGQFYVRLCEWAYDIYDTLDHPALGQSPRDAFAMGMVCMRMGGGRNQAEDEIDPAVGIELLRHIGDRVERGDPLVILHHNLPVEAFLEQIRTAFTLQEKTINPKDIVIDRLGS